MLSDPELSLASLNHPTGAVLVRAVLSGVLSFPKVSPPFSLFLALSGSLFLVRDRCVSQFVACSCATTLQLTPTRAERWRGNGLRRCTSASTMTVTTTHRCGSRTAAASAVSCAPAVVHSTPCGRLGRCSAALRRSNRKYGTKPKVRAPPPPRISSLRALPPKVSPLALLHVFTAVRNADMSLSSDSGEQSDDAAKTRHGRDRQKKGRWLKRPAVKLETVRAMPAPFGISRRRSCYSHTCSFSSLAPRSSFSLPHFHAHTLAEGFEAPGPQEDR